MNIVYDQQNSMSKVVVKDNKPKIVRETSRVKLCNHWPKDGCTVTNLVTGRNFTAQTEKKLPLIPRLKWVQIRNVNIIYRAGHFRYFCIFSMIKNDFFAFLKVNNLFLDQSYLMV